LDFHSGASAGSHQGATKSTLQRKHPASLELAFFCSPAPTWPWPPPGWRATAGARC